MRSDYLFHTTWRGPALEILGDGWLAGDPYISFSSTLNWEGDVTFVFNKSALKYAAQPVKYTIRWAKRHPDKAYYIATGDIMLEPEELTYEIIEIFKAQADEQEFISRSARDLRLRPGDVDKILLRRSWMGPRAEYYMGQLKEVAKRSGLVDPQKIVWRRH